MNNNNFFHKITIKSRFLLFSAILFLLIAGGGTAAFFPAMGQVIRSNVDKELTRLLETKRIELEASVNGEIAIALKMADSPLIKNYFLNPDDPALERLAFEEIKGYRRAFASNSVFWVNDVDKRFFSDDAYSYTIDADDPDSYWYHMTLYETESFNFNINYNENLKKTNLWINAPVFGTGPDGRKKPIGMLGTGIDLSAFIDTIYDSDKTANLYLFNASAEITGAADTSLIFDKKTISNHFDTAGDAIVTTAKSLKPKEIKLFNSPLGEAAVSNIPQLDWYMAAIIPISPAMYLESSMTAVFIAMLVVVLLIFIVFNFFIAGTIKPLKYTMDELKRISTDWDLTRQIAVTSKDEFGELAGFFNLTFGKIRELLTVIRNKADSLSGTGEELATNMVETAAAINEITANIQSMEGRSASQSSGVTETRGAMERIMGSIGKLNEHIMAQSDSVSQSSSAIEQMLANIRSVADTLVKNTKNVDSLAQSADVGRSDLQKVAEDIQGIARESEGLLEINSVIENIASQTNLLSMNAAIEAAHAGEAGKGFAVVADEIRKLAESSSEQSKTISTVLKKIKTSIDSITQSTDVVIKRFEVIEKEVQTVSNQETVIRSAMEEQEIGSRHILDAVTRLNELTAQVKKGSEEMTSDGEGVLRQSQSLEGIAAEMANGMEEMAKGAEQINIAVNQVNEISGKNKTNIDALNGEVSRFKV